MKKQAIGIPRALFFWKRPYFWPSFFENLGFDVLISPPTNKEIVEMGVKAADAETCFSVKILYGHVLWLEGKANHLFIPRLKKNELGMEYCPKFFALPDLFPLLVKTPILSPWVDLSKEGLEATLIKTGGKIGQKKSAVKEAFAKAVLKEKEEEEKIIHGYFDKIKKPGKKIALISHPYNLHDEYVNLRIKKKIEDLGGEVIFIDEVPAKDFLNGPRESTPKFHWEFGEEMLTQAREIIRVGVSGAIEISAFQCGCDAVLKEFVEKEFKNARVPFLYVFIDEYTAEAGLQTRLEAFFDTLS